MHSHLCVECSFRLASMMVWEWALSGLAVKNNSPFVWGGRREGSVFSRHSCQEATHPPPRPLPPSHIQLFSSFSYHPFSSSFSLSPTVFLFSLSLNLFKFIPFLFPRIPLLLPLSCPSRHVFVFSLCFLLVSSRRIPCLLSNSSPLQYVSFLPPSSPLLTYFFSHPLFYADHTPLHEWPSLSHVTWTDHHYHHNFKISDNKTISFFLSFFLMMMMIYLVIRCKEKGEVPLQNRRQRAI